MLYEPVDDVQRGSLPSHGLACAADFLRHHDVRLLAKQRDFVPGPRPDSTKMVRDLELPAFRCDRLDGPANLTGNFPVRNTTQPLDLLRCPIARAGKSVRYPELLSLQHHCLDGPPCLCGHFPIRLPSQ